MDKKFSIRNTRLAGNGTLLNPSHHNSVVFSRFKSLLYSAYLARVPVAGHTCLQDCGPNGSCRCGMCVSGDDKNNCLLNECSECDSNTFFYFLIFSISFLIVLLHLMLSVVLILVTASHFEGHAIFSILGCNCCLCNPQLFVTRKVRRHMFFRCCYRWPLFNVPPFFLFVLSVVALILLLFIMKKFFKSSLATINSIMTEEYYPSDHLLLTATLEFPS